jgi:putative spermidine/putrescine transport system permease protein
MSSVSTRLLTTFSILLIVFLVSPMLVLVPMSLSSSSTLQFPPPGFSLQWYENLTSPVWTSASITSIQVASLTALFATLLGTPAAFGLVRGRFPGRNLVNALILSPIIVPLVIVGIAMLAVFVNLRIAGTVLGLVVAHTVLALPFVVINVGASLRTMDRSLELASMNLGAGPLKTFRYVTLPQILPGVLAGALFAFIFSWDEIVVAIFLTSPFVRTLPVVMWGQIRTEVDPTLAALSTLLTFLSIVVFLLAVLAHRRGRSNGR